MVLKVASAFVTVLIFAGVSGQQCDSHIQDYVTGLAARENWALKSNLHLIFLPAVLQKQNS